MSAIKHIDGYDIHMKDVLGEGSFGKVYLGVSDRSHKKVAVKVLLKKNSTNACDVS